MVCQRCGMNNSEMAKYCWNCGNPMMQVVSKKNTELIIGIVVGCLTFVLLVFFLFIGILALVDDKQEVLQKEETQISKELTEEELTQLQPKINRQLVQESGRELSSLLEDDTENKQLKLAQSTLDILESYYNEKLLPAFGELGCMKTFHADYMYGNYGDYSRLKRNIPLDMYGIGNHIIRDLDGDGVEELLVFVFEEEMVVNIKLYRLEEEQVCLSAELVSEAGCFGDMDIIRHDYYLKRIPDQSGYYLVERGFSQGWLDLIGGIHFLRVLSIENGAFTTAFEEAWPDTFCEVDNYLEADARQLNRLGFSVSAECLGFDLSLDEERDELELVFKVEGQNEELYKKNSDILTCINNKDALGLGTMDYTFYPNQESFLKANRISDHWIRRVDYSNPNSPCEVEAFYDEVFVESNNPVLTNWINAMLNETEEQYAIDAAEGAYCDEPMYAGGGLYYRPLTAVNVYFDDRYISVGREWFWCMGGVGNRGWVNVNYDWTTRSRLELCDILGVSIERENEMILESLQREFNINPKDVMNVIYEMNGDFKFYFDAYNVYVCFDCYDLEIGNQSIQISIPRPKNG